MRETVNEPEPPSPAEFDPAAVQDAFAEFKKALDELAVAMNTLSLVLQGVPFEAEISLRIGRETNRRARAG